MAPPAPFVRTAHGPFTRLSFTPSEPPTQAQHSVYLLDDHLIDTGSSRTTTALLAALAGTPVRRILLTHQHEDHVGNVGPLLDTYGALPVHAPEALVDFLPTFERAPPYRHVYWGSPHPIPAGCLSGYASDETFRIGDHTLRAVHTPGHTPPHHVFVAETRERVYVLSGDVYASKPLEAFLESAVDDTVRSYRQLAAYGERLVLLPTHGRVREDAASMLTDAADVLEREAERVYAAAHALGTRDVLRVAHHLYGDDPFHRISGGEMGRPMFVRSVLDPVRALPAAPLPVD